MVKPLSPNLLYTSVDPSQFRFETTDQLAELSETIGQDRALTALHFGIGIRQQGYNLYVLGPTGLGKHDVVHDYLKVQAQQQSAPADWVYVNNFANPSQPNAISLNPGEARTFREDMRQLVEDLRSSIPAAFEAEEYQNRVQEIEDELKQTLDDAFSSLTKEAESHSISLLRTPHGFAFAPVRDKQVLGPEEFEKLPEKDQQRFEETIAVLEEKLTSVLRMQPQWQRDARQKIKALDQEIVMFAVGHLIDDLRSKYLDNKQIQKYLGEVQDDVVNTAHEFRNEEDSSEQLGIALMEVPSFKRYAVNVFTADSKDGGAPVVYEAQPNYSNLIGAVEHTAHMGALQTDFTLIKPGALHRANGGYLILDVMKLLMQPFAWETLKTALSSSEIKIQSISQLYSWISTVSLEPEPIPLNVKVILIGDRTLYYLLHAYDPEFKQLFKVAADFNEEMPRTAENQQLYARLIATLLRRNNLRPFDRTAVARVIEYSSRHAEDAEKLSTYVMNVTDLLREADYYASQANNPVVHRDDVQLAIDAFIHRNDRLQQDLQEEILRGTIMIDSDGSTVGQINALAVIQLGDFDFAIPSRITATARLGEGEVIDIERETELGGATHSKGVFILSAFVAARYAREQPLSLSASLTFEQSYGMIEGDSASMAELCALLSVLADIPIKQNFAITGSVNQRGDAQAIGGVNEKIEGFFDICQARGLNGEHGVLIPESNKPHLMLRADVIEACRKGEFAIYTYRHVDDAIAILTGESAEIINQRIIERLEHLEKLRQEFSKAARGSDNLHE